jgi:uncharacterized membrane protein
MRRRFLGIICLLIALQPASAEKRWAIKNVEINANVDSAGYLWVEENRTYQFWGKFSYAFYELPLADLLEVDQIQVLENGEPYQLSNEKTPGTFLIERSDEKIHIRWQFRGETQQLPASGNSREFTLRFRVLGTVRVHRAVAELYCKFVGTGWDRASEKVRVTIQLPQKIRREEIRAWAHGPLHGSIAILSNNRVELAIAHLPRRQFWEARVVFPARYLSAAPATVRDEREVLPEILTQETRWAEEANRRRAEVAAKQQWQEDNRAKYFSYLWILLGAGAAFSYYVYQRYGRSLRNPEKRLISEPPTDMPPAVANYTFYSHQLNGGGLLATIFDLAARNFLRLQHTTTEKNRLGFSRAKQAVTIFFDEEKLRFGAAELLPYERDLLNFLRTEIAQNRNQFDLEDLKKQSTKFHRFFRQWRSAVAQQAGKPKLYDTPSVRGSVMAFMMWLLIAAAYGFAVYTMGDAALPFVIISLCLSPLAFLILRFTRETASKLDRLHGFRDYLKRFSQNYQRQGANWQQIDKYLVYAIALGLATKQIKPLFEVVEHERGAGAFPWFIYSGGNASTGFSSAMSAMVDAVGASMSSASGAGGGAAAGGGGGAGGSGGGAG